LLLIASGDLVDALPQQWRSGCHRPATLSTSAAGVYAVLHITEALAVGSALLADFRAFSADMLVVRRSNQHEMCSGAANLGAGRDEAEV